MLACLFMAVGRDDNLDHKAAAVSFEGDATQINTRSGEAVDVDRVGDALDSQAVERGDESTQTEHMGDAKTVAVRRRRGGRAKGKMLQKELDTAQCFNEETW